MIPPAGRPSSANVSPQVTDLLVRWAGSEYFSAIPENDALLLVDHARIHDLTLLTRLMRRHRVIQAVRAHTRRLWIESVVPTATKGTSHDLESVLQLAAEWLAVGLVAGRNENLSPTELARISVLCDQLPPVVADSFYTRLIAEVAKPATADRIHNDSGRLYLLVAASTRAFEVGEISRSHSLASEAVKYRDGLTPNSLETAKALTHLASRLLHVVSYLEPTQALQDRAMVIEIVDDARVALQQTGDEGASGVLQLGVALSNYWFQLGKKGGLPSLEAGELAYAAAIRAEGDLRDLLGMPTGRPFEERVASTGSLVALEVLPVLGRLLTEASSAAAMAGRSATAEASARAALQLAARPVHRFDAGLHLASVIGDVREISHIMEHLLTDILDGQLDELTINQRDRVLRRMARQSSQFRIVLKSSGQHHARRFWGWQIGRLFGYEVMPAMHGAGNGAANAHPVDADLEHGPPIETATSSKPKDSSSSAGQPTQPDTKASKNSLHAIDWIVKGVAEQQVRKVIRGLMFVAANAELIWADGLGGDAIRALQLADLWRPDRRAVTSGTSVNSSVSNPDVVMACLTMAEEFARGYCPHLQPEIVGRQAFVESLGIERRRELATRAAGLASVRGRGDLTVKNLALSARLSHDLGDAVAVASSVAQACEVARGELAESLGGVELLDVAERTTAQMTSLADWCAYSGYPSLAFHAAATGLGWLGQGLALSPQLVTEFELAERERADRTPESREALYQAVTERVVSMLVQESSPGSQKTQRTVMPVVTAGSTVVQLVAGIADRVWALVASRDVEGTLTFASAHLPLGYLQAQDLRARVWLELRPSRAGRPVPSLVRLHEEIVAPVLQLAPNSHPLLFVLHGALAGLPVHAARGPEGFLIEQRPVSYLSRLGAAGRSEIAAPRTAMVGGWDGDIHAPQEASEVTELLVAAGFAITRPRTAKIGKKRFLDPEGDLGLLHIAAHGDFRPWPQSLSSVLVLSPSVRITAADWLRNGAKADFVFLNACNLGNAAPRAGDLNGFPLAMRVRGTQATLAALGYIPPDRALEFARAFYERLPGSDTTTAYQAAVRHLIDEGAPACAWAPYLHDGPSVAIPVNKTDETRAKDRFIPKAIQPHRVSKSHRRHR